MTRYRNALPQLDGSLFLTDAGIETTLICERCLLASSVLTAWFAT